jgi:hypothetical protein
MWYLYTMEFYSATKKNEILSFASKWMELENIVLSKFSQAQKTKNCMFSLICGFRYEINAVILLDMSHTIRGEHIQEEQGKVGSQNLKVFDVPTAEALIQ